ncbi:MAG: DUF4105 domain-containing protein [bacterium]
MMVLIRALPLLFLVLGIPSSSAMATETPDDPYVEALLEIAHDADLSGDPHWRTLVHYKRGLFGLRSLIDDPNFFLAKNGKQDPAAELDATIRAFFTPADQIAPDAKHPVCRFVARFDWLKTKLAIDESRLPVSRCDAFEELIDTIKPESATLIFPASHMNSPASMYGHTLLTIRTVFASDLLAYAVNYSAISDETFGPLYIIKGLLGSYEGFFSILPYYAKLQEYSDVSDRDIWEYPLDLNTEEIRRLLMHVYEMQNIYADYYFFSENCSYDLLFLLDVARPGVNLTDQCGWWVIPLDTIREVRKSGLIDEAVYRPSRSTKIKHLASLLTERGRRDALAIAEGTLEPDEYAKRPAPTDEKIKVCDLASEYLQYTYAKKELTKDPYVSRFLKTLTARSTLGDAQHDASDSITAPERPDGGHHSNRLSLGFGFDDDEPFQEIRVRPAYHTLLDSDAGYKRGSQLVFTDFVLRYHSQEGKLELEALNLIDIISIAPRDEFFRHTSWKVRADLFRRTMENGEDYLVSRLNPGFGVAYETGFAGLFYAMLETDLHVGGPLDGNYSAGGGASAGFVRNLTGWWKLHLFADDVYHVFGDDDNLITAGLGQNLRIHPDMSVALAVVQKRDDHDSRLESTIRWNVFF